jgi:hypothetical protein
MAKRSHRGSSHQTARTKSVLEIIGLLVTIAGGVGTLAWVVGKVLGVQWIVLTPSPTVVLRLQQTADRVMQLTTTTYIVLDNRGLGNGAITSMHLTIDFGDDAPMEASTSDFSCRLAEGAVIALPLSLPANEPPLRVDCSASRPVGQERIAQLSGGAHNIEFSLSNDRGKNFRVRYCVTRSAEFWQRFVSLPKPVERQFLEALCNSDS